MATERTFNKNRLCMIAEIYLFSEVYFVSVGSFSNKLASLHF